MIAQTLPDIPRAWTALAEWAACLVYVLALARTGHAVRRTVTLTAALPLLVLLQLLLGTLPLSLWIPGMVLGVVAMFAVIRAAGGSDTVEAGYFTARAFVLAEFTASLHWQLAAWVERSQLSAWSVHTLVLGLAVHLPIGLAAWYLERRLNADGTTVIVHKDLWSAVAISVVTFSVSNLSFLTVATPFSARLGPEVFYVRTLVDLCGIVALYAQQERIHEVRAAAEVASMSQVLRSQHDQYLMSKANIEAASRAHHDLKHHIEVLRAELDPARVSEHFEELEESVRTMGTQFHSGNPVLDVILTSKANACAQSRISFTAVADGALLDGMSSMDIATLFGNALDNAIEASVKVIQPDRRLIRLALHSQGEMTVIRVENWFDGSIETDSTGTPLTSKGDRTHHGFGVKSIRWTAAKYGGAVTTSAEDGWFTLTVLLPSSGDAASGHGAARPLS